MLGKRTAWIMASCNSEGRLLQPSTPIRTIDAKFSLDRDPGAHAVPVGSEVWASSATVMGPAISYTTYIISAWYLPKAGFKLWRNDTVPTMVEGADYVYRVQGVMAHGGSQCANGSIVDLRSSTSKRRTEPHNKTHDKTHDKTQCVVQKGRDILSGTASAPAIPNSTHDECCAACAANPSCTAWIFGLLNGSPTCFPANNVGGTRPVADRDFCCMDGSGRDSGGSSREAPQCAAPVPADGVPLSTEGGANCTASLSPETEGHQLVTVYPVVNGFVLLGELAKWVSVSPNRFSNLVISDRTLSVDLAGGVGELCSVTLVVDGVVVVHHIKIGSTKVATLTATKNATPAVAAPGNANQPTKDED
jgi:hypothetical protein